MKHSIYLSVFMCLFLMGCSSSAIKHETLETGDTGRYQLSSSFMVDTKTGRTWKHISIKNDAGVCVQSYWSEEFVQNETKMQENKPAFDETQPFEKVTINQE